MKKSLGLIARAALISGIVVAVTAQSASAHSGSNNGSRGKSCIAHSRHKPTTHPHGFRHECTQKETRVTIPGSPDETTVIEEIPAASTDAVTPEVATGISTPDTSSDSGRGTEIDSTISVPATSLAPTPALTDDSASLAPVETDAPQVNAPTPADSVNDVTTVDRIAMPSRPASTDSSIESSDDSLANRSIGAELTPSFASEMSGESLIDDVAVGGGNGSTFSWWWLLLLVAIAAEAYRRWRRARRNRGTVSDAMIAA